MTVTLERMGRLGWNGRLAAFFGVAALVLLLAFAPAAAFADESAVADAKAKADRAVSITVSAVGDCTLGVDSRYNSVFNSYYKRKGAAYFLKKVRPVFAKDDLTIVNFEGTLTTSKSRADKAFTFKGPAKYASILTKSSVEVANLANNHSLDFGAKGLADTKRTLKKRGIAWCMNPTIAYKTVKGVKVAFLGFDEVDGVTKAQVKAGIKKAKKAKAAIIIVSFHWGIERDYYPAKVQKKLGRYAIDCGASLVLGHHPHVLQGIEEYKGRYIVHSLGNFCFGGNTNPKDKDTMIFQQTFTVRNGELTKKDNARIIPCSLSGSKTTNTFQPRILKGSEKKALIKKMNRLSNGMGVKVASNGRLK